MFLNKTKLFTYIVLAFILCICKIHAVIGQNLKIDSLLTELSSAEESELPLLYNELSEAFAPYSVKKSLEYAELALKNAKLEDDDYQEAEALYNKGIAYYYQGDYTNTLEYVELALEKYKTIFDTDGISRSFYMIGVMYYFREDFKMAVKYYLEALSFFEKQNDKPQIAGLMNNIGNIYFDWGQLEKSLEYFEKALVLYKEAENSIGLASAYNNIGNIYKIEKNYDKALYYYDLSLEVKKANNNQQGIAMTYHNIAEIYEFEGNINDAIQYYNSSISIYKQLNNQKGISMLLSSLGSLYWTINKNDEALEILQHGLEIAKKNNFSEDIRNNYKNIAQVYESMNELGLSLMYYKQYSDLHDSIFKATIHRQIEEAQTKYETEKKEKQIELLNIEKELKNAKIKRQTIVNYTLIFGVLALFIISFLVYNRYRLKRRANFMLRKQNAEIEKQRDEIRSINLDIRSSIEYANKIQNAVLQPTKSLSELFPDSFIVNKPRDIVSGDFYWFMEKKDRIAFTVADCTGHGVPGAFMSMLGLTFVNEIFSNYYSLTAAEYLKLLREKIKKSLHQTGKQDEAKDGMDVAFCLYHKESKMLEYAGANNPLYIIKEKNLMEYKADKMPIGIYFREKENFTNHTIRLNEGDAMYLFTDGYVDQFGGNKGGKFLSGRFKELLLEIHNLEMNEQKRIVEDTFLKWKGDNPQVDDILVMGIRV